MRLLAIDLGRRRVGLALSDPMGVIASPHSTLDGRDRDRLLAQVAALIREREVAEVVVGLPRNMDGSLGPQAEECQVFAEQLRARIALPVHLWDERLTTTQALGSLREMGRSQKPGRQVVDQMAAAILLQAFLDRRRKSSQGAVP